VISCGDLSSAYLEFIISVLNVPLFYVRGNHDENYTQQPPGGEDLHRRVVRYNGLTFAGLEGSIRYNQGSIQYSDQEMAMMVVGMAGGLGVQRLSKGYGLDIFVAHSPPRGIHDLEDRPHHGFHAFLQFMRWYRPRYMLHGHVHTYDRRQTTRTQYHATMIMNINPVTVLEIDP
ncbi:MAG: metallophosphoesterase, partial [Armatimonadetes bacterium]|nr:metallophosphoesterase [Anaerolineae bacterium]